jgi:hypothetical protein
VSHKGKWEYFRAMYERHQKASRKLKQAILNEFCLNTGYHRKYTICLLNGLVLGNNQKRRVRRRKLGYGHEVLSILTAVWEAAGYSWSVAPHRELRMRMCRTEQTAKRRLSCAV